MSLAVVCMTKDSVSNVTVNTTGLRLDPECMPDINVTNNTPSVGSVIEIFPYYSCGLSTATIEYSSLSVCLCVCLCVCLSVCLCTR